MAHARAFLGAGSSVGGWLPFNPDTVQFGYHQNQAFRDTLGGRVYQLLSVGIDDMTVSGVAGDRRRLLDISRIVRDCMAHSIDTQRPVHFKVPTRNWDFLVYPRAMPQIGWSLESVEYPYRLVLAVEQDLGVATQNVLHGELARLRKGIGYSNDFSAGDPVGAEKIVSYIMEGLDPNLAFKKNGGGSGGGTGDTSGSFTGAIGNAPFPSKGNMRQRIFTAWKAVFGEQDAHIAVCVADRESSFVPTATNHYVDPSTGQRHIVYGLFQISDVHREASWWPTNAQQMFDPDYNTRCAMAMRKVEQWVPWASTVHPCGG